MRASTCFTRDQLERYIHGRAEDELSDAIEVHLESCSRCEDTLCELDPGEDTLIRTLQVKGSSPTTGSPDWVEQIANAPYQAKEQANDGTLADPPDELGDYELVDVLGRGGMSVVFAARHKHLGREVALKVLLPTTQQHIVSRERFVREMRAVGGLDHPAIVRATDAGECNDTLYLVMERVDGVDLNRVSQSEGPLRVADACAIGVEVARGLAHAHEQGIVHRDIKPSNLMLDHNGNVKILDFGLARMQSAACDVSLQTTMGQLLGTLDYMAPEQANGSDVDPRADIYALGAALFKLLTGAPPHGRSADMPIIEFLNRLATNDANRLDENRDQLPSELVDLVATMLERDPTRRVASAHEVAERLQCFADDADLRKLAASAIGKRSDSQEREFESVKASLAECWPQPVAGDPPPKRPPTKAPTDGWGRRGLIGCGAVACGVLGLFGLVALTIILSLKSGDGVIRIESEVDDVRVEIVDENERADVIAVEQGEAMTAVRTGRYRIRLDSPADGFEVTPQQVTVTKNNVVIATVRKLTPAKAQTDAEAPQRDPVVAMEAQIELSETMSELTEAKNRPEPDAEQIAQLEAKLSRLRALSRPIPTEPVYRGRTLADWVAQMRFEQEEEARKVAAETVLKLAETRPDEEQMALLLEAGSRLFVWDDSSVEYSVFGELYPGSEGFGKITGRIKRVDRSVASSQLGIALQSEDQRLRDFALVTCADLRTEIQRGEWPTVLEALAARSKSDTGSSQTVAQVAYAGCLPDPVQAAKVLEEINTNVAGNNVILAMIFAATDWQLGLSRSQQISWVATYLTNVSDPSEIEGVWGNPVGGPFAHINWDHIDDKLQADINTAVIPLLESFERQLAIVAEDRSNLDQQFAAALKSDSLTMIIDQANLTGATRAHALQLLNQRLEQLLQLRASATEEFGGRMDTPTRVAVAITLLTGEVPKLLKKLKLRESGFLGQQLETVRNTLLPAKGKISSQIASRMSGGAWGYGGMLGGRSRTAGLAEWYPYEMLSIECDSAIRMRAESRSQRSSSFSTWLNVIRKGNPSWRVDSRLMLEFADASPAAAEFVDQVISVSNDITAHLLRHPEFAKSMTAFMEDAKSDEAAALGFRLWSETKTPEEEEAKLKAWIESGDAIHTRMAIQRIIERQALSEGEFYEKWGGKFAAAIDRIAESEQLTADDMKLLHSLASSAPRAAEHAVAYLDSWLKNPESRPQENNMSGLQPCAAILLRAPELATRFRPLVAKILEGKELLDLDLVKLEGLLPKQPE